jgi:hypothetical protein
MSFTGTGAVEGQPWENERTAYTGTDYTVFAHERTMGIVKKLSHQGLRPSEASGSSAAVKSEQCWPVGERPPPCTHFVKLICPRCIHLKAMAGEIFEMPYVTERVSITESRNALCDNGMLLDGAIPRIRHGEFIDDANSSAVDRAKKKRDANLARLLAIRKRERW